MDPKLAFWTFSLLELGIAAGCAVGGFLGIRQGKYALHRRLMKSAAAFICLFLVSYLLKLTFLGREDFDRWTQDDLMVLRVHESLMFVVIVCGFVALYLTRRFVRKIGLPTADFLGSVDYLTGSRRARRWHRRLGRIAVIASLLGLLTAAMVLRGMYRRAGQGAAGAQAQHSASEVPGELAHER